MYPIISIIHGFLFGIHHKQLSNKKMTACNYCESSLSLFRKLNSRKEMFQPHLPVRLPCYDLAPIICFTLGSSLRSPTSGTPNFHRLTGGVYKARERIHRIMADIRLLTIPTSRSRVADCDPNWDRLYRLAPPCEVAAYCTDHCSTCVAQDVRAMMI